VHSIKVGGENYNTITYRGSYGVVTAHALNDDLRSDEMLNSIGVGIGASTSGGNKKTASIYHPHKFKKEY
jgi:hypothetical protein